VTAALAGETPTDPPCIDCGDAPGSLPGGRCRDCDIAYMLGLCWCCREQVERHEWSPTGWRLLFGTDPPPPVEAVGHAPDCAAEKARSAP
jgi:hypothetical protein